MVSSRMQEVVSCLGQLKEEPGISKRFKDKADSVIALLTEESELAVEKSLIVLEELNSIELSSYHRTQVWGIISMLECISTH